MLIRILVTAVLLIALELLRRFIPGNDMQKVLILFVLYLVPYLIIGHDILRKAWKGIRNGQIFDESFLMAVATVGAFLIAVIEKTGDFTEAVAVMLFYQIGEWFQSYAVGKSRGNISELMDIRPDYANIEVDGQLEQEAPGEDEIDSHELATVHEPPDVILEPEDCRSLGCVVDTDTFEDSGTVVECVGEDVNLRILPLDQFSVEPNKLCLIHSFTFQVPVLMCQRHIARGAESTNIMRL